MAGKLIFDEKIPQSAALFWFRLPDVGILYSRAVIQRTIDVSPAFLEHYSAEKIALWDKMWSKTSRRLDSFLHEAAQNFELLSNIQDQK